MERKISDEECPVRKSMQIFAGKWTLLIIFQINRRIIRYGELKRAVSADARPASLSSPGKTMFYQISDSK